MRDGRWRRVSVGFQLASHVRSAGAECVYLPDAFASGAVGACVTAGVEVLYVLIVTPGPELGLGQGACLSLLICAGRGRSAPRSAA